MLAEERIEELEVMIKHLDDSVKAEAVKNRHKFLKCVTFMICSCVVTLCFIICCTVLCFKSMEENYNYMRSTNCNVSDK